MSEVLAKIKKPEIALALLVLIAVNVALFFYSNKDRSMDFSAFYRAATLHPGELYDHGAQNRAFTPEMPVGHGVYFYHPAFEVMLYWPLTHFPYRAAFAIWALITLALLVLSAWLLHAEFPQASHPILLTLAFCPTFALLWYGQDSALLLILFTVAFLAFRRNEDVLCGVALALTLIKFQYAIPFVFLLAFRRRWRVLAAFSAAGFALVLASCALIGTHGVAAYVKMLQDHGDQLPGVIINLRGLSDRLHLPPVMTVIASICLMAWFSRQQKLDDRSYFLGALVVAILVSYHSSTPDAVLLLLPLFASFDAGHQWPAMFWLMFPFIFLGGTPYLCLWVIPVGLLLKDLAFVAHRSAGHDSAGARTEGDPEINPVTIGVSGLHE